MIFINNINFTNSEKIYKDENKQSSRENMPSFEHNGIRVYIKHKDTDRTLVDGLNQFFAQL